MRIVGLLLMIAGALATTQVVAQDFDASGPSGPRTTQDDAQQEIVRLRAIIRELESEISRLRDEKAPATETAIRKGDLLGTWLGNVSCGRRQFTITFSVDEQFGRVGKGKWEFSGAGRGTDEAQISPMAAEETPNAYALVTAQSSTYDYVVEIDGNTMKGKASNQNCKIYLERG
nr:hypothetical protein [uncultured Shinella sp.]